MDKKSPSSSNLKSRSTARLLGPPYCQTIRLRAPRAGPTPKSQVHFPQRQVPRPHLPKKAKTRAGECCAQSDYKRICAGCSEQDSLKARILCFEAAATWTHRGCHSLEQDMNNQAPFCPKNTSANRLRSPAGASTVLAKRPASAIQRSSRAEADGVPNLEPGGNSQCHLKPGHI